ncbi:hypothetical protein [Amycolatopsis sp. cmx-11-12]|uniref:hypothetical protein n=1 Tax=Amycolatopsis sp. cmx-11-12 TaxID=2785795 RepID=UPI00391845C5
MPRAGRVPLGHAVSPKRVWRLMRDAGLRGRHPKPWKRATIPGDAPVPTPDLIGRDFTAEAVNQRWCGDIPGEFAEYCTNNGEPQLLGQRPDTDPDTSQSG